MATDPATRTSTTAAIKAKRFIRTARSKESIFRSALARRSSGTPATVCSADRSVLRKPTNVTESSCTRRSSAATRSTFSRCAAASDWRAESHASASSTRASRSPGISLPYESMRCSRSRHDSSAACAPGSFSAAHSSSSSAMTARASSAVRVASARSSRARNCAATFAAPDQCHLPSSSRVTESSASSRAPFSKAASNRSPSSLAVTGSRAARSSCHAGLSLSRDTSSRSTSSRCHADASESTSRRMCASLLRSGAVSAMASSISAIASLAISSCSGNLFLEQSVRHCRMTSESNAAASSNTEGSASASAHASNRRPARA